MSNMRSPHGKHAHVSEHTAPSVEVPGQAQKPHYRLKNQMKVEDGKVTGLDPIGNAVVGTYFKIQDGVVGAYKRVEDRFVDTFLEPVEDDEDDGARD